MAVVSGVGVVGLLSLSAFDVFVCLFVLDPASNIQEQALCLKTFTT